MPASSGSTLSRPRTGRRFPARLVASGAGVVFALLGLLGFVPGVTADLGDLALTGPESQARLFGVFQVSVLLNTVHLVLGAAGLILARTARGARSYLVVGGAVALLLWVIGISTHGDRTTNFLPANRADDWLHLLLGTAMVGSWVLADRYGPRPRHR